MLNFCKRVIGRRSEKRGASAASKRRVTGGQRPDLGVGVHRVLICDVVASGGAFVRGSWPFRKLSSGQFQAMTGGAPAGGLEAPSPWGWVCTVSEMIRGIISDANERSPGPGVGVAEYSL